MHHMTVSPAWRSRLGWFAVFLVTVVVVACKGGGSSGY